jgi:SpoIIAA-like
VIEHLDDLPAGVVGFRASGRLGREEYRDVLMPPITEAIDRGEPVDLYFEFADDFHGVDLGGLWEDLKAAGTIGLGHRSSLRRTAMVTDKDWIRHGVSGFGWLSPGELRVFEPDERDAAIAWVAGGA